MNKLPENLIEQVRALRLLKKSFEEIAAELNISYNTAEHAARLGKAVKKRLTEDEKAQILELRKLGSKPNDIAKKFGISRTLVFQMTKMAKPLSVDKKKLFEKYIQGVSLEELAKENGLKKRSIQSIFYRENLKKKERISEEQVKNLLKDRESGFSISALSDKYNLSRAGIKHHLKKANVLLPKEIKQKNVNEGRKKSYLEALGFASHNEYMDAKAKEHGGVFKGNYTRTNELVLWECKNGHEFLMRPHCVIAGQWCPRCAHTGPSSQQIEIFDYIKSLGFSPELSNRSVIISPKSGKPLELDIYVPAKKFAIEFNGLIWHSSLYAENGRHLQKAKACRALGINLLAIFQDEWANNKELIKAMIRHRLGILGIKLRASKLEIKRLNKNADFISFFDRNHLDGNAMASYAYGLFFNGKLVSAMSVRTNHNGEREIARFATDYDFHVYGAAGRLVSAIKKEEPKLISFSNNRLSNGNVYKTLGFSLVQENDPSYWYTDGNVRIWRFKCKRINDPEILAKFPEVEHTEQAQAEHGVFSSFLFGDRRPLYKIEDYGHLKWSL